MKLTTRCGEAAVAGLNEALWAKAVQAKLLRTARVRADTTVIPANVAYPTDLGLLARAVERGRCAGCRPRGVPPGPGRGTGGGRPAARLALGAQVLTYAMARPGASLAAGYRGLFAGMGFGEVLSELERRQRDGEPMRALIDAAPDELLSSVGYYGPAGGAAEAYARLSAGLDETVVRIVSARPGLEPVVAALEALTPARIRAAAG